MRLEKREQKEQLQSKVYGVSKAKFLGLGRRV
jgi:hypothetical protein